MLSCFCFAGIPEDHWTRSFCVIFLYLLLNSCFNLLFYLLLFKIPTFIPSCVFSYHYLKLILSEWHNDLRCLKLFIINNNIINSRMSVVTNRCVTRTVVYSLSIGWYPLQTSITPCSSINLGITEVSNLLTTISSDSD